MNEITIDGKTYISSKRAAEITGYAKDYVGQLCREGHIDAKMVGRSWYVYEPSIRAHRFGIEAEPLESAKEDSLDTEMRSPTDAASEMNPEEEGGELGSVPAPTWQKPTYTPELPQELPEIQTPAKVDTAPAYSEPLVPAEQTLTDMQAAWREWFERKQEILERPEIETAAVIEARKEAVKEESGLDETQEVPTQVEQNEQDSFKEEEEEAVPVPIHTIPSPTPQEQEFTRPAIPTVVHDVLQVATTPKEVVSRHIEPEIEEGQILEERIVARNVGSAKAKRKQKIAREGRSSNAPLIAFFTAISLISIAVALIGSGMANRYFKTSLPENPIFDFLVGNREYIRQ